MADLTPDTEKKTRPSRRKAPAKTTAAKTADKAKPATSRKKPAARAAKAKPVAAQPRKKRLITKEELLAMGPDDYMNEDQLEFFRDLLKNLEAQLRANASHTTANLRETITAPDDNDRATIEEEHALELRTRDRERKLLKKVQAALVRIDNGSYGFCEETGDPIGVGRLLARPTATLSLEEQQRREHMQKLYGN